MLIDLHLKRMFPMRLLQTLFFCGLIAFCLGPQPLWAAETEAKDGWIKLFDGKTLNGWHKNPQKIGHGTGGKWTVEPGGVLAGEQDPPGSGNGGVLLTDRKFGDFELSLEMKPSWGIDSGVFLRSTDQGQCIQMTVDYYDKGNIGQMYGEATGGWVARPFSIKGDVVDRKLIRLTTIDAIPAREAGLEYTCTPEEWLKAWKVGDWNKALIRVEGGRFPKITTHINGAKVCVFDAATSTAATYDKEAVAKTLGDRGSIAVQVHGGGSYPAGAKCRWRDLRVRELRPTK
jgi:hypothetical protein